MSGENFRYATNSAQNIFSGGIPLNLSYRSFNFKRSATSLLLTLMLLLSISGCRKAQPEPTATPTPTPVVSVKPEVKHKPSTEALIKILEEKPEIEKLLVKSIEKAKEVNPDKETNPAQSLEEYYEYLDWAAEAMPWNISKNLEAFPKLYEKIDQSLNYFYFINDMPLEELDGKGLYNNSLQYAEPYRTWLIDFTKQWGEYLSTPESWNEKYYEMAREDPRFGLDEGWYEEPSNWKSFNDFFARYLKSADQRPIASPEDAATVVAPADSTPQGVWEIDDSSNIIQKEDAVIKSKTFNSIPDLIGEGSEYRDAFAGGVMTHTFLDVYDYHRYHFPVGGTIKEVRMIPQDDAVGGAVIWDPATKKYVLHADTPGWQMIETRGCVIIDTDEYGLVALLPIGMSQVSSVNFEDNIKVGETVKKGDMLGYFLFGGSDYVMIFQKDAGFELTVPTKDKDNGYEHVFMGEAYGKLNPQKG